MSWDDSFSPFVNGEVVMYLTNTGNIVTKISCLFENFGIVPFRCGLMSEYGKWASVLEGVEGAGILANAKDPAYTAHIISAMF